MKRPMLIINDHEKIDVVYKQSEEYLKANNELHDDIAKYLWAYNEIMTLVPQTMQNFGSGHFFPFSESYYEIENSLELSMQGFYRHSLFALRCGLELSMLGIFFDADNKAHIDVKKWIKSEKSTPSFNGTILPRIFKLDNFFQFNNEYPLQQKIKDVYSELSNYVHTRGYNYSNTGKSKSNFNQFNEQAFCQYIEIMKNVIKNMVIMILLKYPIGMQKLPLWEKFGFNSPAGDFLDESSQRAVFNILDEKIQKSLQKISNNDLIVKEISQYILEMPDISEEQLNEQRAQFDEWIK